MISERNYDFFSLKCVTASFFATYFSGVVHPLDLIKTRFQSHDGKTCKDNLVPKYSGIHHAIKLIYQNEGLRGLYKGFYISLLSQASAMSFFFWQYETRKSRYEGGGAEVMQAVTRASIEASFLTTLVTQPLWVVKTRMLLNTNKSISELQNLKEKVRQIRAQCGMKGFLRGIELSLLLSFSGVIQMYVYQGSKILYQKLGIPQSPISEKHFICGSLSKIISTLIYYPVTTLRTRIQQSQYVNSSCTEKYKGLQDLVSRTWREEGVGGLYKGMTANLMRGVVQKGIYFYLYEIFKQAVFPKQLNPQFQ